MSAKEARPRLHIALNAKEARARLHIAIKQKDEAEKQSIDPEKVKHMVDNLRKRIDSEIEIAISECRDSIHIIHAPHVESSKIEQRAAGEEIRSAYVDAGYNISELKMTPYQNFDIRVDWKNM